MAEALLISAATGTLKKLLPLATDQIRLAWGFKKNLEKLGERLKTCQALLRDAENRKVTSETMMDWLKKLKAATCVAENVLDELAYEDLRRKIEVQNRLRNKVRDLKTLSDPLSFRFKMANKVNKVNKLFDELRNKANNIGLSPANQLIGAIVEPMEFRNTGPSIGDTVVVGRDKDVLAVVDMLLGSQVEGDLPVIAIVGMPGLGKTTLAQLIYKQAKIRNYFNERMWICVSENFKIERLLNEMVESLTAANSNLQNRQGILGKLTEKLKGRKYLLVLDDVWNTTPRLWVDLRNSLLELGGSKESKILVTTRSQEVVLATQNFPSRTYELTQPSKDDCWTMFWNISLAHREPSESQTLEGIGRRLIEKCKGLPLAICTLGGLLYSKQNKQEWEFIEKNELWSSGEGKDGILPVLRLSFNNLPSPCLKQSFAYCSIFPKDHVIEKDVLIQLWMGLGYLQPSSRSKVEMEELGNEYFVTLLRNSLFQEAEFDEYNNITSCKMHDLVHDLAHHVSQGNCYTPKDNEVKINSDVQHLSLFLKGETRLDISEETVRNLRTLFLEGDVPQNTNDFKCIRALRLVKSELTFLTRCMFIHLRFLDISESSICEVKVPSVVTKLYNLETLILSYKQELPKDFHNLVSLRHFYLRVSCEIWGNRYKIGELMPMNIGRLTSLQTLSFFVVGKESGHIIEELGSLSKLSGTLNVFNLQHVKDKQEAEKAKILGKPNIQELIFHWDENLGEFDNDHEDVLEGLKPHQNVKGLILNKFGGRRLASWMSRDAHLLQNLVNIELNQCRLCEQVPALGHLPHLKIVILSGLHNLKCIGREFYGTIEGTISNCGKSVAAVAAGVFPALREFTLCDLPQLEEWSDVSSLSTVDASSMEYSPRLQLLVIFGCPKLKTIPGVVFSGSTSVKTVQIDGCSELRCFPEGLLQPTLEDLSLNECPKLKTPNPDALRRLTSLKKLWISRCPNHWGSCWEEGQFCTTSLQTLKLGPFVGEEEFTYFPWPSTSAVPPCSHFTSLERLFLWGMPEVKSLPDQIEYLTALRTLSICDFSVLESLPEWLGNLSSLQNFGIVGCPLLGKRCEKGSGEDWHKIAHIPSIVIGSMVISGLHNLKCIGPEFYGTIEKTISNCGKSVAAVAAGVFPALREFILFDLPQLEDWWDVSSLPTVDASSMKHSPRLRLLEINRCPKLKTIPGVVFSGSTSVETVKITTCPELRCFPEGLLQPTLEDLDLNDCPKLKTPNPDALRRLTSLKDLWIKSCPNHWGSCWEEGQFCTTSLQNLELGPFGEEEEFTYFPWPSTSAVPPCSHFTSLVSLFLIGMPEVKSLPDQIEHLTALRYLKIYRFSALESLPEWLGNLSSLQHFRIEDCPLLGKRCEKGRGEDWHKIAHIPNIRIDGKYIQKR